MNKKRLLCIILTLVAAVSMVMIRDSAAWINSRTGEPLREQLQIKKMTYTFEGTLETPYAYAGEGGEKFIVAGKNLIKDDGTISGTNNSNMDTELRVGVKYKVSTDTDWTFSNGNDTMLLTFEEGWSLGDGNYFYLASANMPAQGESFDILSDIQFNDNVDRSVYFDSDEHPLSYDVCVVIQAKQADNVTWSDLDVIETP